MAVEKYVTRSISGIITQIAILDKSIPGYSEGVIEAFLPEDGLTEAQEKAWIKANNKRMTAICKFLNDNNL